MLGPGEIVGPRRLSDVVVRPLNSTVRQHLESTLCFNYDLTAHAAIATFRRSLRTHSFARLSAPFAEHVRNRS